MENSSDPIGNRTRDLAGCSAVIKLVQPIYIYKMKINKEIVHITLVHETHQHMAQGLDHFGSKT
jgi:hypothetical protein